MNRRMSGAGYFKLKRVFFYFGIVLLLTTPDLRLSYSGELENRLYDAAYAGDLKQIKELIAKGASVTSPNAMGGIALHAAAVTGHIEILNALLDAGADPHSLDVSGANSLNLGAGYLEVVKVMLQRGADINNQSVIQGKKVLTALMAAASDGNLEVTKFLLSKGADPKIKTWSGKTALDLAIKKNHTLVVEELKRYK